MEWGSRGEGSLVVGGSRDGRGEGMVGVKRMKAVYRIREWDEGGEEISQKDTKVTSRKLQYMSFTKVFCNFYNRLKFMLETFLSPIPVPWSIPHRRSKMQM